ncbi:NAD-dependent epimerase/dehydratase family protein [Patescibacteria group bacterium]
MFYECDGKVCLVTGGAGFIGSHFVEKLISCGARVIVVDNFVTGSRKNLEHITSKNLEIIEADASQPVSSYLKEDVSFIFHLASPASPDGYMKEPEVTYMVNSMGTHHLCEYARKTGAKLLFTSTSEIYGDPLEHPQKETYWGNVNPTGPRACYDESKRFGEMVVNIFQKRDQIDARVVRIFNTYGPRMGLEDGRVIPNFLSQAIKNEPITVHGDGTQTRSFCYVDDLVKYILRAMIIEKAKGETINIGRPGELTMKELAEKVKQISGSSSQIKLVDGRDEDISQREPDISKAISILEYEPKVDVEEGLRKTIEYFRSVL